MQRILYCFIVFALLSKSNTANSIKPDSIKHKQSLAFNYRHGALQYHHSEMEVLKQENAFAFQISYVVAGNTNKLWHSFYRNPQIGITYKFMDLGNREILGYSHTLFPFINIPIIQKSSAYKVGFSIGSGLAYLTKKYHFEENNLNLAISTNLNAFVDIGLFLEYRFYKKANLTAGFHLSHFSNGTLKKPNYGLNYTLVNLGLKYDISELERFDNINYSFSDKNNRFAILGLGSLKEINGIGGPKYSVLALSLEYSRQLHMLWRYGFSVDIMSDKSNAQTLNLEQIQWDNQLQLLKTGITFNTEFIFDRLSAVFYFGGYTYNKSRHAKNEFVYQRLGLRYRFTNNLWLHLALKTHWNVADYIELGVAVKIK